MQRFLPGLTDSPRCTCTRSAGQPALEVLESARHTSPSTSEARCCTWSRACPREGFPLLAHCSGKRCHLRHSTLYVLRILRGWGRKNFNSSSVRVAQRGTCQRCYMLSSFVRAYHLASPAMLGSYQAAPRGGVATPPTGRSGAHCRGLSLVAARCHTTA